MGGGPEKEHMLIVTWGDEPTNITAEIKRRFPYIDITYFDLRTTSTNAWVDNSKNVPPELFKNATILVTFASMPATAKDAPNLNLIHLFSAGVDHWLNHPILKDSNIAITTSGGIHGPPIAEWVVLTTLAASKRFTATYEWQKQHRWGQAEAQLRAGTDWVGKRVGIAGYGSIGRQVARVFNALGAHIVAYTASPRDSAESRKDHGYIVPGTGDPDGIYPTAWFSGTSTGSLHTFLQADLDALVICLPLTPATTHLFSTGEFALLRGCYLLNISRGKIIDTPALVTALNDETLAGAALDVTDPEPLPADNQLWDAKNITITPHVSALGKEYIGRAFDVLITNLARREKGEKMFNLVDRRKGY